MIGRQIGDPRWARSEGITLPSISVIPYRCASSAVMKVPPESAIRSGSVASAAITRPGNSGDEPTAGRGDDRVGHLGAGGQIPLRPFGHRQSLPQRHRRHLVWLELDGHVAGHPIHGGLAQPEDDAVGVRDADVARRSDDQSRSLGHHESWAARRAATKLDRTPTSTICQFDNGLSQNGLWVGEVLGKRECIVDQYVQPALLGSDLVEQRFDLVVVGVVDVHGDPGAAASGDLGGRLTDACRAVRGRRPPTVRPVT